MGSGAIEVGKISLEEAWVGKWRESMAAREGIGLNTGFP